MSAVWQEEYLVKSFEVDFNNRLKLNSVFNYMQEAANNHANALGLGTQDFKKLGFFWVMSKAKINLEKYPYYGEYIKVKTWPKAINKFFATRDFLITDAKDKQIGAATTLWLILDLATTRPQKIEGLPFKLPTNEALQGINENLDKIKPQGELTDAFLKKVFYGDIDVNNHVNNAKYVEWVLDSFSCDLFKDSQISSFQINFLSEAKIEDEVLIKKGKDFEKANLFYIEGVNNKTQNRVFQSQLIWS